MGCNVACIILNYALSEYHPSRFHMCTFNVYQITCIVHYTETGKTVSRAISSLQEHGVKVEKIILVTLFATPQGRYL